MLVKKKKPKTSLYCILHYSTLYTIYKHGSVYVPYVHTYVYHGAVNFTWSSDFVFDETEYVVIYLFTKIEKESTQREVVV